MSDSLRDQLLGLGFKPAPVAERKPAPRKADVRSPHKAAHPGAARQPEPARRPHDGKPRQDKPRQGKPMHGRPGTSKPQAGPGRPPSQPRTREEIDLARAYAIRAQKEKDERIEAERLKQEQARERREAKAKLAELLKDQALNDPAAEIARHFDYGGKIKRIHVTPPQLKALNAGELGVVQLDGRYLLVTAALLEQAAVIFPPAIALKVDPTAPVAGDPYADPQYQVPDDLVW
jgi:uncharacterized protein YaiL (DUF2058 family)